MSGTPRYALTTQRFVKIEYELRCWLLTQNVKTQEFCVLVTKGDNSPIRCAAPKITGWIFWGTRGAPDTKSLTQSNQYYSRHAREVSLKLTLDIDENGSILTR